MSEPAAELPVTSARDRLAEVVNQAAYGGEITYLTRHGKRLAAVVPLDVAESAEADEDAWLSRLAAEAREEMAREGSAPIPLAQVLADLETAETDPEQ
jgi:prevent-host-death family protein